MTIESGTFINDLNASYPEGGSQKAEGDNHIRLLKLFILNTFPNVDSAIKIYESEGDFFFEDGAGNSVRITQGGKLVDAAKWDGATRTVSTSDPSGGSDGDIHLKYE